ncbi:hypothetical protein A2U01_0091919, partial [Trifolium medium]|nr:hypothetical protein [Trifolium medium]
ASTHDVGSSSSAPPPSEVSKYGEAKSKWSPKR